MGIELYPKFISLAETRCYQPLCKSIVAKCCQDIVLNFSDNRELTRWDERAGLRGMRYAPNVRRALKHKEKETGNAED